MIRQGLFATKNSFCRIFFIKQVPARVILASVRAVFDPLYSTDCDDLLTPRHVWYRLLCVHPVSIKQKPSRSLATEVFNHRMEKPSGPRWIRNDKVHMPILHI